MSIQDVIPIDPDTDEGREAAYALTKALIEAEEMIRRDEAAEARRVEAERTERAA